MSALIIDCETTGIEEPEPIEVAWMAIPEPSMLYDITMISCFRFKPSKMISLGALATHHIRDEELANCAPATELCLPDGIEFLIGHNVDFDWKAIGSPDVKRIDTCAMSRWLWPGADSHSLGAMLYLHHPEEAKEWLVNAHSASYDVANTRTILGCIFEQIQRPIATWNDLWLFSEEARIPKVMPFGKHRGTAIRDLPRDYAAWCMRQADFDPYVMKAIRKEHQ